MPTLDTEVGRLKLVHPDLGHDGGAGLHTKVRNAWTKIADNSNSRFGTSDALADAASVNFEHNFKDAFGNLQVILYKRNTGTGELTRLTGASSPTINDFSIAATGGLETTSITVTNNSGGPQDIAVVILQNGGGASGSGGGGGGSLAWVEVDGSAPILATEFSNEVMKFDNSGTQLIRAMLKVPDGYVTGDNITMDIGLYTPETTGTILLSTTSTLIKTGTDAISSTTNQHSSTNSAIANTGTANVFQSTVIDVTDGSGLINGVAPLENDLIIVELFRGTDTAAGDVRFLPSASEVAFK